MKHTLTNNRGFAMVMAVAFIAGLSLLAVIVVAVATSEKKTEFAEYTHSRAFYSADAAGEGAINWLRFQGSPPVLLDVAKNVYVATGYTPLSGDHDYKYDIQFLRKRIRPGWSLEYKDFEYLVDADGASVQDGEAEVEIQALRLYKEGY